MMGIQTGLFFTDGFYFTSSIDVGSEFTFVNSASFEDKGNEKMNSLNHLLNIIQIILTGPSTPVPWIFLASCLMITDIKP